MLRVPPTADELTRYYHLNDDDLTQLTPVSFLGTFLDDLVAVPSSVLETLSRQLGLANRAQVWDQFGITNSSID